MLGEERNTKTSHGMCVHVPIFIYRAVGIMRVHTVQSRPQVIIKPGPSIVSIDS